MQILADQSIFFPENSSSFNFISLISNPSFQVQKLTTIKSANALSHHQKHSTGRYNGYTPIGNGLPNSHHTPIYAKQPIYQQQAQTNQQQLAKVAKQTSLPLPPLYSTAKITAKAEQQKTVYNTLNHSTAVLSTTSSASASASPSTGVPTSASVTPSSQQKSIKQTQQRPPTFKQPTGLQSGSTGGGKGSAFQPPKSKGDAKIESSQSINGITANGVGKGKKIRQTAGRPFAKPQAETKIFVGKKLTTVGKSQASGKPKRSYSQLSYHEPLQRIPPRLNAAGPHCGTGAGAVKALQPKPLREWHAPEAFIFDYAEPSAFTADQLEVAQCTQAFWFKDIPNASFLTREQRLEIKRDNLRRQAFQYAQAQQFRSTKLAKRRLLAIAKALTKYKTDREE